MCEFHIIAIIDTEYLTLSLSCHEEVPCQLLVSLDESVLLNGNSSRPAMGHVGHVGSWPVSGRRVSRVYFKLT